MISAGHKAFFNDKKNVFLLLFVSIVFTGYSQHQNIPINYAVSQKIEKEVLSSDELIHTAVKPFQQTYIPIESYNAVFNDTGVYYYDFTQKLFKESLLSIEEKDVYLVADPLMNFGLGRSTHDDTITNYLTNTRGVRVAGNITSKFSFETRYYENQFYYPKYLDSIADARGVAFGLGRAKVFKGFGHDVGMSSGYVSYSPTSTINIQFGQGKHFIGNGYRSMLLSDNAFNYPYLSFTFNLWEGKLFYKSVNAWLRTLERIPVSSTAEALYKSKSGTFRYLSFKPKKQIEIGLFEGVIYNQYNDSIGEVPVNPSFYIPVIGAGTVINSGVSENKVVLGANMNISLSKTINLYGQFVVDDFSNTGFQVGGKWMEVFKLKNSWLMVEYNNAVPYLYSQSQDNILQNYSHSNQELAHPLGASFNEIIAMAHFEKARYFVTAKYFYALKERQGDDLYGESIFLPNDDVLIAIAPEKINWTYFGGEFGVNLNVKTRMQLFGSVYSRSERGSNWENHEWFWQMGLRTTLNNFYFEQ